MEEITLTKEQLDEMVEKAIAEELEKLDTEGKIAELTTELEGKDETYAALEVERDGLNEKVTELEAKLGEMFSEEDLATKITEARENFKKEIETFNARVTRLTEADIDVNEDIQNDIREISDEQFELLAKILESKVVTPEPETTETETTETTVEAETETEESTDENEPEVATASVTSTRVPVGTTGSEDEKVDFRALLKKVIDGEFK